MFLRTVLVFATLMACMRAQGLEIEIMSYNVENLFDTVHDEGKADWEYTPLNTVGKEEGCRQTSAPAYLEGCLKSDWTQAKLDIKLSQINRVVRLSRDGKLPDVLVLQEIENSNVISQLAKVLGYQDYLVTDSPDERGIDVAILFNQGKGLQLLAHAHHRLRGPDVQENPTRDILEAAFLVNGEQLTVIANHWPSQNNPVKNRLAAARLVRQLILDKETKGAFVVAAGDFNVVDTDFPHPFHAELQAGSGIRDLQSLAPAVARAQQPLGSFFFGKQMQWNLLDHFFVGRRLLEGKGLTALPESYAIYAPMFATGSAQYASGPHAGTVVTGVPQRFLSAGTTPETAGFSDHFPIVFKIRAD